MTTPRFLDRPAMLLAGLRRHHEVANAPRDIPPQWNEFNATPLRHTQQVSYGVTCSFDVATQRMEYMCAVEVSAFEALPEGTGRMRVPAATYAVFDVHGPPTEIRHVWGRAMHWEATNGEWQDAHTPSFERYEGERCEIWLPVKRRT